MKSIPTTRSFVTWLVVCAGLSNAIANNGNTNYESSAEAKFRRAKPRMIWGQTTNFIGGEPGNNLMPLSLSLRAGVDAREGVVVLSGQPLKTLNYATLNVFTDSPQVWVGVPPFHESVILSMTGSNGVAVPKTAKGASLGQPLTLKPATTWFRWAGNRRNPWFKVYSTEGSIEMIILADQEKYATHGFFVVDPTEYFSIKNPGLYQLTVTLRLYVVDTNAYLKPITLPPVTVPMHVATDPPS